MTDILANLVSGWITERFMILHKRISTIRSRDFRRSLETWIPIYIWIAGFPITVGMTSFLSLKSHSNPNVSVIDLYGFPLGSTREFNVFSRFCLPICSRWRGNQVHGLEVVSDPSRGSGSWSMEMHRSCINSILLWNLYLNVPWWCIVCMGRWQIQNYRDDTPTPCLHIHYCGI